MDLFIFEKFLTKQMLNVLSHDMLELYFRRTLKPCIYFLYYVPLHDFNVWFVNAELFRNYLKQIREETSGRLLSVAYRSNGTPNKWWLAFAKRKFMNVITQWRVVSRQQKLLEQPVGWSWSTNIRGVFQVGSRSPKLDGLCSMWLYVLHASWIFC